MFVAMISLCMKSDKTTDDDDDLAYCDRGFPMSLLGDLVGSVLGVGVVRRRRTRAITNNRRIASMPLGLRPSETERVSRRFVCFMYMACKRPIQCSGPCWENFCRFLCSFNCTSMWLQRMCRYDLRRCSERTPSSCSSVRNSACEKLSSTSSCRWPCGSFFLLLLFLVTSLLEQLVSPGKGGQKRY